MKFNNQNIRLKLIIVCLTTAFLIEKFERLFLIRKSNLIKTSVLGELIAALTVLGFIMLAYIFLNKDALTGYALVFLGMLGIIFSSYIWNRIYQNKFITGWILIIQLVLVLIELIILMQYKKRFINTE